MENLTSRSSILLILALLLVSVGESQMRSGKFGIGLGGSAYLLQTDEPNLEMIPKFGVGVGLSWSVIEHLGIRANFAGGQIGWKQGGVEYVTSLFSANFYVSGDLFPHQKVNPFAFAGVGGLYFDPRGTTLLTPAQDKIDIVYSGGVGVDFFLNEFISITGSGEIVLTNTDNLEGIKGASGTTNDYYFRANLEFRYYFFDQDFITKLLEAMRARK
jgi:hypothetical protein